MSFTDILGPHIYIRFRGENEHLFEISEVELRFVIDLAKPDESPIELVIFPYGRGLAEVLSSQWAIDAVNGLRAQSIYGPVALAAGYQGAPERPLLH